MNKLFIWNMFENEKTTKSHKTVNIEMQVVLWLFFWFSVRNYCTKHLSINHTRFVHNVTYDIAEKNKNIVFFWNDDFPKKNRSFCFFFKMNKINHTSTYHSLYNNTIFIKNPPYTGFFFDIVTLIKNPLYRGFFVNVCIQKKSAI